MEKTNPNSKCKHPGCDKPPRPWTRGGWPPAYCDDHIPPGTSPPHKQRLPDMEQIRFSDALKLYKTIRDALREAGFKE